MTIPVIKHNIGYADYGHEFGLKIKNILQAINKTQ